MSQAQQAAAECTLGRQWPDRRTASSSVEVDPTHPQRRSTDYPASDESLRRAAARQYAAVPMQHTGFGLPLDLLSDEKREQIREDARGEDLWLARGGVDA